MKIVPENKLDFDACANLASASDEQVIEALPLLLEWLQDLNWPVAAEIIQRVSALNENIDSFLIPILRGTDDIWKYSLISGLLVEFEGRISEALGNELVRIINQPTASEVVEEVNLVAKEIVHFIS